MTTTQRKVRPRRRYQYARPYVRRLTHRRLYQARPWHPVVGSINLGLYRTESAAWAAVAAWVRAGCDPCRGLPPKVLPKWVRWAGAAFRTTRTGGHRFPTAEAAHRAAVLAGGDLGGRQ